MLVSVDIVDKDFFLRTTKNPSIEGLSDLTDIKRYYKENKEIIFLGNLSTKFDTIISSGSSSMMYL